MNGLTEMGFGQAHALAALKAVGNSVEDAIAWIEEHPDTELSAEEVEEIMAPLNAAAAAAPEYTSEELSAIAHAEAGDSAGQPAKKLSSEEAKALVQKMREAKALKAKEEAIEKEIKRREDGKKKTEMQEEIQKLQRQREAENRKREADFQRKERDRLRMEMLKDKVERYEKRGEPVPQDLQQQLTAAVAAFNGIPTAATAVKAADPKQEVKAALTSLSAYKRAEEGKNSATTLKKLVQNTLNNPAEAKFKSVNLANNIIKDRIVNLIGGVRFLRAVGFEKNEETNTMELRDSKRDDSVLQMAVDEVDAAIASGMFNEF